MKKLLLTLIFAPVSVFAVTVDSKVETTGVFAGQSLVEDNFKDINELQVKYNNIDGVLAKFEVCKAKNKAYLGVGVAGADSDECVDIKGIPLKRKSKKPSWAGFVTWSRYGTLMKATTPIVLNDGEFYYRLRADYLCQNAKANSRAMTANDIKYVYNEIPFTSSGFTHSSNLDYMWLFDSYESVDQNEKLIAKYPFGKDAGNCKGWSSSALADKGSVLEVTGGPTNYYLKQNQRSCNQLAVIGCVYN